MQKPTLVVNVYVNPEGFWPKSRSIFDHENETKIILFSFEPKEYRHHVASVRLDAKSMPARFVSVRFFRTCFAFFATIALIGYVEEICLLFWHAKT